MKFFIWFLVSVSLHCAIREMGSDNEGARSLEEAPLLVSRCEGVGTSSLGDLKEAYNCLYNFRQYIVDCDKEVLDKYNEIGAEWGAALTAFCGEPVFRPVLCAKSDDFEQVTGERSSSAGESRSLPVQVRAALDLLNNKKRLNALKVSGCIRASDEKDFAGCLSSLKSTIGAHIFKSESLRTCMENGLTEGWVWEDALVCAAASLSEDVLAELKFWDSKYYDFLTGCIREYVRRVEDALTLLAPLMQLLQGKGPVSQAVQHACSNVNRLRVFFGESAKEWTGAPKAFLLADFMKGFQALEAALLLEKKDMLACVCVGQGCSIDDIWKELFTACIETSSKVSGAFPDIAACVSLMERLELKKMSLTFAFSYAQTIYDRDLENFGQGGDQDNTFYKLLYAKDIRPFLKHTLEDQAEGSYCKYMIKGKEQTRFEVYMGLLKMRDYDNWWEVLTILLEEGAQYCGKGDAFLNLVWSQILGSTINLGGAIQHLRAVKSANLSKDMRNLAARRVSSEVQGRLNGNIWEHSAKLLNVDMVKVNDLICLLHDMENKVSLPLVQLMANCLPKSQLPDGVDVTTELDEGSVFRQIVEGKKAAFVLAMMVYAEPNEGLLSKEYGSYLESRWTGEQFFECLKEVRSVKQPVRVEVGDANVKTMFRGRISDPIWDVIKKKRVTNLKSILSYLSFIICDSYGDPYSVREIERVCDHVCSIGKRVEAYDFLQQGRGRNMSEKAKISYQKACDLLKPMWATSALHWLAGGASQEHAELWGSVV